MIGVARRNPGAFATFLAAVVVASLAAATQDFLSPIFVALALVQAAGAGFLIGRREAMVDYLDAIGRLPKSIRVHEDDDGVRHAFVERQDGDIETITIPDDLVEREDVMRFLFDVLEPGE